MRAISAVVGLVVLVAAALPAQDGGRANPSLLKASFSRLPIYFIENRGVYPYEVAYYVQGADKTLFFTNDGITFRLNGRDRAWVVKLEFVGASRDAKPRGEDRQEAVFSYFRGPEEDWKTGLRTYAKVVYENLWPGIDLVYKGTVNRLKYDFVVHPGADPGQIRLRYRGVTSLTTGDSGSLRVETPEGSFEDEPPVAWQEIEGERVPVEAAFSVTHPNAEGGNEFGFRVGSYDTRSVLILDPVLIVYCGYVGGANFEVSSGAAVDAAGNLYVVGTTNTLEKSFPVKIGPFRAIGGSFDAFVAKVNASGTALIYCGYLGGTGWDQGEAVAVDAAGCAHVAGKNGSTNFPFKRGPGRFQGGCDAFLTKVNAAGTDLVYSGSIGGWGLDSAAAVALDSSGRAYVTGSVSSDERSFPVRKGPDLTYNGGASDAFVARVNSDGTLDYCGYLGGVDRDFGNGIAVSARGEAFLTGETRSWETTFPVRVGPDLTFNVGSVNIDGFVAKIDSTGTGLVYCGYIGGGENDQGCCVALDAAMNLYVGGFTESDSRTFPVRGGPSTKYAGFRDGFLAKVKPSGAALEFCGYVGGRGSDVVTGVAVDGNGDVYAVGYTDSTEATFPVLRGPDLSHNGRNDGFVAKLRASGNAWVYCGFIGGTGLDGLFGLAVDTRGNAFVAGSTSSQPGSLPLRRGPFLNYGGGAGDALVAKVALTLLSASGPTRIGGTTTWVAAASDDAGHPYQIGTSLGTGPIHFDTRKIDLSPDALLAVSVGNFWPSIFSGYRGIIDAKGQARAAIHIPNIPALIGLRLHSAFVTLDPAAPSGIRSISNTFSFSITK